MVNDALERIGMEALLAPAVWQVGLPTRAAESKG